MIVKFFELKNKNLKNTKFFLLYGNNKGLIEEILKKNLKPISSEQNILNYDESELIKNLNNFEEEISNKSFFDKEKLIIIRRASDKIYKFIEEVIERDLTDIIFVLISDNLEKRSKLRTFFEKDKRTFCIPFYEDTHQTLTLLAQNFLRDKKILLSQQNINLVVERCKGDRINLYNELEKIQNFSINKKKISSENIIKLTNLSENISYNELVDNALARNQKKTLYILNENNFVSEDSILILRIFINKLKRLLRIQSELKIKKNLDEVILSFRPPIFWKEKDVVKKQIGIWSREKILDLIFKTNDIELVIKKNPNISINVITNFILEQTNGISNEIL